jgi:hypothetical protein
MSNAFGFVYRLLFPIRLRDASSSFLVAHRSAVDLIFAGRIGLLKEGFWWEFMARAFSLGLRVVETPVRHRSREAGTTRVYKLDRIPGIAIRHLAGLFALRRELRDIRSRRSNA